MGGGEVFDGREGGLALVELARQEELLVDEGPVLGFLDATVDADVGFRGPALGEGGHAQPDLVAGREHVVAPLELVIDRLGLLEDADARDIRRDDEGQLMGSEDLGRILDPERLPGGQFPLEVAQDALLGPDLGLDDIERLVLFGRVGDGEDVIVIGPERRETVLGVLVLQEDLFFGTHTTRTPRARWTCFWTHPAPAAGRETEPVPRRSLPRKGCKLGLDGFIRMASGRMSTTDDPCGSI